MKKIIQTESNFTGFSRTISTEGHIAHMKAKNLPVLFFIAQNLLHGDFTECPYTQGEIAKKIDVSREKVGDCIKELAALGYIKIREEKRGFKTKQYFSLGQLPELTQEKEESSDKHAGRDTTKATAKRKTLKQEVITQKAKEVAPEQAATEDKLYEYYLTLWARTGGRLDKYSNASFRNSKAIKAAIAKHGEDKLTRAYLYAHNLINKESELGIEFRSAGDYIINPDFAISELENYEKEREEIRLENTRRLEEAKNKAAEKVRQQEENKRKQELRPVAKSILLEEGLISEKDVKFIESTTGPVFPKITHPAYKLINKKVDELFDMDNAAD